MLLIRRTQFAQIGQLMEADAVEALARQLQLEYPQRLDGAEPARRQARSTMDQANAARIESAQGILDLARLLMRFGVDMAEFPDPAMAQAVLAHASLPGDLKIEFLRRRLAPPAEAVDEAADEEA